jgi:hypothetical protein
VIYQNLPPQSTHFAELDLKQLERPPLGRNPLYIYLSLKRAELVSKVVGILKDFQSAGRIKEISDAVEVDLQK